MRVYMSFRPLYFSTHFALTLLVSVVVCVLVNLGIDYLFNYDKSPPFRVPDINLVGELLIFHFVVPPLILLTGTGGLRKDILAGKRKAVHPSCYKRYLLQKIFLFSMSEPNWKKRWILFSIQSLIFPGFAIFVSVVFFCWCAVDFGSLSNSACSTPTLWGRLAITEAWKGLSTGYLIAVNYGSAHHADQPELSGYFAGENDHALSTSVPQMDYSGVEKH
jgi:hypothetical protein